MPNTLWQRLVGFVRDKFAYIVVAGVSVVVGMGLIAGYGTIADTETKNFNFCAHSCHEMGPMYTEFTHTRHFKNAHGVVLVCTDCHVPHSNWPAALMTRIAASGEVWTHLFEPNYIKHFDAHRAELAKVVWDEYAANNAAECKACHKYSHMVLAEQNPAARAMHAQAMKTDANCLDCHKGIAHDIVTASVDTGSSGSATAAAPSVAPQGQGVYSSQGLVVYSKNCAGCHSSMTPKTGDKAAWAPLIKQGEAVLVDATIRGKGVMPPRGGNSALSDADIKAAVEYMLAKSQ